MTFDTEAGMNGSRCSFDGRQLALSPLQLGNYSIQVIEFTGIHKRPTRTLVFTGITSGYAVVHGRGCNPRAPKPLKIQVFRGHPAPRGRTAPIF